MGSDTLQALHAERVDRALWAAVRTLEEQVAVSRFMQQMAQKRATQGEVTRYGTRADAAQEQAEALRELLLGQQPPSERLPRSAEASPPAPP